MLKKLLLLLSLVIGGCASQPPPLPVVDLPYVQIHSDKRREIASIGDLGGFSGGAAGGAGSATSTLQSVATIHPDGGGQGGAGSSELDFGVSWDMFVVPSGGSAGFYLFDAGNGALPFDCLVGAQAGVDNCAFTGTASIQNADGSQVILHAPAGISGVFWTATLPPAPVAGGYWFDSAGNGVLTENVPILSTTSASFNHGGVNITANSCESESATTLTGTTTGMVCSASPTTSPGTAFTWDAVCGSGSVTVRICNISAAGATPGASTYNIRVIK